MNALYIKNPGTLLQNVFRQPNFLGYHWTKENPIILMTTWLQRFLEKSKALGVPSGFANNGPTSAAFWNAYVACFPPMFTTSDRACDKDPWAAAAYPPHLLLKTPPDVLFDEYENGEIPGFLSTLDYIGSFWPDLNGEGSNVTNWTNSTNPSEPGGICKVSGCCRRYQISFDEGRYSVVRRGRTLRPHGSLSC